MVYMFVIFNENICRCQFRYVITKRSVKLSINNDVCVLVCARVCVCISGWTMLV